MYGEISPYVDYVLAVSFKCRDTLPAAEGWLCTTAGWGGATGTWLGAAATTWLGAAATTWLGDATATWLGDSATTWMGVATATWVDVETAATTWLETTGVAAAATGVEENTVKLTDTSGTTSGTMMVWLGAASATVVWTGVSTTVVWIGASTTVVWIGA